MANRRVAGPRLIAIVGPFQSGKTSLLESLLARAAARRGRARCASGTSVGDSSPEARAHAMSVEPNIASVDYMGDRFTFFDCPGSVEFIHDMRYALPVCDAAVVVCEADPRKTPALQVILRELEELGVPRILFLNKIDLAGGGVREALEMLQPASRTPLLLRQMPIWENGVATGFVDLALERAFVYRESAPSEVIEMPAGVVSDEKQARYCMLERLADYDDALMEQLISDIEPPRDRVFDDLANELREGHVVPLMIGSATAGHGVTRLLKALRHEAPGDRADAARGSASTETGPALAQVVRTIHTAHGGKLSLARVLRGAFADGAIGRRLARRRGAHRRRRAADGRGCRPSCRAPRRATPSPSPASRASSPAIASATARSRPKPRRSRRRRPPPRRSPSSPRTARTRSASPRRWPSSPRRTPRSLYVHDQESGELKLFGQGEMHLRVIVERLAEPLRRRGRDARADRRLSRDDPRYGHGARAAQEAVGRPRPVRRRAGRGGAARARRRLRLRRETSTAARCRGNISPRSRWARATR